MLVKLFSVSMVKFSIFHLIIISFCFSCASFTKVPYPLSEAVHKGKVKVKLNSGIIKVFDSLEASGDVYYGYAGNYTIQFTEPEVRGAYINKQYSYVYRTKIKLMASTPEEAVNKGTVLIVLPSGKKMKFDSLLTLNDLFYGYKGKEVRQFTKSEIKEIYFAPIRGYLYSVSDSSILVSLFPSINQSNDQFIVNAEVSDIMSIRIMKKAIVGRRILGGTLVGMSIGFIPGVVSAIIDDYFADYFYIVVYSGIGAGVGFVAGAIAGLASPEKIRINGSQEVFRSRKYGLLKLSIVK